MLYCQNLPKIPFDSTEIKITVLQINYLTLNYSKQRIFFMCNVPFCHNMQQSQEVTVWLSQSNSRVLNSKTLAWCASTRSFYGPLVISLLSLSPPQTEMAMDGRSLIPSEVLSAPLSTPELPTDWGDWLAERCSFSLVLFEWAFCSPLKRKQQLAAPTTFQFIQFTNAFISQAKNCHFSQLLVTISTEVLCWVFYN